MSSPSHEPAETTGHVSRATIGRWCVALAAIFWSLGGLFAKSPLFADWPVEVRGPLLAFWRALFAGLLLLPMVRKPRWTPRLIPLLVSFSAMSVAYMSAMSLTTAANAIWLQNMAPGWVLIFSLTILREPLARADWWMLAFAAAGVGLILFHELRGQAQLLGTLCGMFSGIAYAGAIVGLRMLRAEDSFWLVALNLLVSATTLLPVVLWYGPIPHGWQLPVLIVFGLLQMALPYVLFARGLQSISAQEATAIGLLEPLLLPIWVYLAWGEVPAWWTICGGSLIFAGLALRYGGPLVWQRLAAAKESNTA